MFRLPKNVHILGISTQRLPRTGLTVREAVRKGRHWWEKTGREYFRRARDREQDGVKDDKELAAQAQVLFGVPWDDLDWEIKIKIVGEWYKEFVRAEEGKIMQFDRNGDPKPFEDIAASELIQIYHYIRQGS